MGFNKVYRSLTEVFPQIDARVLRAVAIEHSKDADAAVETVLSEIIPFFSESSRSNTPLSGNVSVGESSQALGGSSIADTADDQSVNTMNSKEVHYGYNITDGDQQSFHDADDGNNEPTYDIYDGHRDTVHTLQNQGSEYHQTDETFASDKLPECSFNMSSGNIPCQTLGTLQDFDAGMSQNLNLFQDIVQCVDIETEINTIANKENEHEKPSGDVNTAVDGAASLTVDDQSTELFDNIFQLGVINESNRSDLEDLEARLSNDAGFLIGTGSSTVHSEDTNFNDSMSQASQMHIIEVLEQAIGDARNNKTTLFSTMRSVVNLMKEVEHKEQAAEQANVEASMGANDILVKVEELKQRVQHTKEVNNTHAGEVYGEKSILASELRELQSRVLCLSDERDKSLAVLDEMRQALEVRLADAENNIRSADHMKVEKEKAAMEALADEELIMAKVVQESKILKQQAEENAKLQEFLVDRGHIVDMLQGEIGVICQDVRLLKEKFDDHTLFSKSLSSSQTNCISFSSVSSCPKEVEPAPDSTTVSSSLKEVEVEPAPDSTTVSSSLKEVEPMLDSTIVSSLKEVVPEPDGAFKSFDTTTNKDPVDQLSSEGKIAEYDAKTLLEDGWELCDDNETFG